ncbi:MAG: hypothetical protein ACYCUM_09670 [Solirubrobacteraceae bacterium]
MDRPVADGRPAFRCSASRESLPIGAGSLETAWSGVTTLTESPALCAKSVAVRPETAADAPFWLTTAAAVGTMTGPGRVIADAAMPIAMATVAAVATINRARTPKTVRMHPFS